MMMMMIVMIGKKTKNSIKFLVFFHSFIDLIEFLLKQTGQTFGKNHVDNDDDY